MYGGARWGPVMTTGNDFGMTAMLGSAKINVALPSKFDPEKGTWMLWKPQVLSCFEMIGLEGILHPVKGVTFSRRENRFVIDALSSIVLDIDRQRISTLQVKWAHQGWVQLEKAYGSSAEMDMQKKLFEFDCARQSEIASIREWAIRLKRQVKELNVMAQEAARENRLGFNKHRDTAVYESTHKFRLLNVRIDDAAHGTFIAELRTRVYQMSVRQVEAALITYEQGRLKKNKQIGDLCNDHYNVLQEGLIFTKQISMVAVEVAVVVDTAAVTLDVVGVDSVQKFRVLLVVVSATDTTTARVALRVLGVSAWLSRALLCLHATAVMVAVDELTAMVVVGVEIMLVAEADTPNQTKCQVRLRNDGTRPLLRSKL
jgi:hypothetical protein